MTKTFSLLLLAFAGNSAFCQYGDAYHKPNEMAIQEAKWRASRPVNTGSSTSSTTTTTRLNVTNPMTLEEYFRLQRKNSAKSVDAQKKEEEIKKSAPQGYYEKIAAKYGMDSEDIAGLKHWDMAKPFEISFMAAGLSEAEAMHLSRKLYKVENTKKGYEVVFVPNQNILNAGTAFSLFQKEFSTGAFEQLMDYVMDFRYAPLSTLRALDRMEQRFPEKREVIMMARAFPALYAHKGHFLFTPKERKPLLGYLQTLFAEMPQIVLAEDKFVGLAVGYNEIPPFQPLYEEALKKKDLSKAREIVMVTLLSDSSAARYFVSRIGNWFRSNRYSGYKAPKQSIFSVDDIVAIHNHIKDAPEYKPRQLSPFFYKMPAEQRAIVMQKINLPEKEFNEFMEYYSSFK